MQGDDRAIIGEGGPTIIWCNEAECQDGGGGDPTWDKMTNQAGT